MAGAVQGPLNPEPALASERTRLHMPPKSYAAAAEQGLDSSDDDLTDALNGTDGHSQGKRGPKMARSAQDKASLKKRHIERDGNVKFEEQERRADGHALKTGKPDDQFEDEMRLDKGQERRPVPSKGETELVSGRKAGANWDRR
jgi:2-acylglycerol O-acyltransferase 2